MQWDWQIKPRSKWLELNVRELFAYKDLLLRLVRRDFLMLYQQTLLGPAWIILQPLLTVLTYILIFDKVMGISTSGVPPFLFYLTGITLWNLFSDIFTGTASIFITNSNIFSKVYFPRLIVPLSTTLLHFMRLGIQLLLLIAVILFYHFSGRFQVNAAYWVLSIVPMVLAGGLGLACGLIFSVLTARYRDLMNLLHIIVRLLMFVCPIFFSLSLVPVKYQWIININPLTPLFELFRYAFIGQGQFTAMQLLYSAGVTLVLLAGGTILFNKKADALLDVV
ncbi:MAG TPA: ABC transporter permease [Ferruginibacter sp.]|jgi:lipopolysaccharide transport system permease protein|nr:ABC transporter permease [Ferruginibacter sp.]